MFSTEESRADAQREKVVEIPLSELHPFKGHPFKVKDDEAMMETADSIKQYGVLVPAIARPDPEGGYELVAGHRRHRASELAEKETMPVIVRDLDDDAATIIMVDSNLQRESLLPSERAFAYKMKLEAMKHQGERVDLTSSQVGTRLRADEILAQQAGSSRNQVQRFIRLTELIPELLDMVDEKKIALNPAYELSFLKTEEQRDLLDAMDSEQATPSLSQAQRLKKFSHAGQTAGNTAQAASKTGKAARTVKEKAQQAGAFVMRHKKGFLIAGVLFLITCMMMNTMSEEVPYEYYILNVKLTSKPISAVASELLTPEQMEMYQVYRQTMGNKPLLFGGGSPDMSNSEDLTGVQFVNGTRPGNPQMVELAKRQVGNVGGYPYWSWYGFDSRVEWCACFVSWCYNQAGKSEPRFAGCEWQGVPWFQSHGQWGARGYNNLAPGDAIFFDWDLDGTADHVGIVIGTDGSRVYTVEGNSGDACKIKSYDLNYQSIKGYWYFC